MQNKLIKRVATLLSIILIPVLLFAGVYGFVWWKVSEFADDFSRDISPFAEMKYKQIHIDLAEAEVGLRGMNFTPTGMEGDIGLESVILKAPSWGFILSLEEKLSQGELPEEFNVDIKGLDIDLKSGYMQDWGRMASDVQRQAGPGYDTLGCGKLQYFSVADMRKMGYSRIRSDLSVQYSFDAVDKKLNFDMQSKTTNMADMSISMDIGVASDTLNMQTIVFAQPELKRVETRFYDRGYNKRRSTFCADLNKESVADYRLRYAELFNQRIAYDGWTIPESLLSALDSLNKPGGSMYFRVDLPQGFGMQSMAMVQSPVDLIDALNPYVEFNGKPVVLDGVSWSEPDPDGRRLLHELETGDSVEGDDQEGLVLGEKLEPEEIVEAEAPVYEKGPSYSRNKSIKKAAKSFKTVELPKLSSHIGEPVILYTYFGRKVQGKLITVTEKVVTVEHRLIDGRGTATYPIARNKIETARLYY
jgi:hypothetical protein